MVDSNIQLHYLQNEILKKLSLSQSQKFNDLLIEGLESEHMNYHLKKLIDFGFVWKSKNEYVLTDFGKDYSNRMDDEVKVIEKQPKTSILINGVRLNKKNEVEFLLNKRLKHPYYGKVGRLTGKVRFGESLEQAVRRELYEETGLTAKNVVLEQIYHKLRHRETGEYVQDVIFYIFFVTGFEGNFISKYPQQENLWITSKEAYSRKDLDLYDDLELIDRTKPITLSIVEQDSIADGF